MPTYEYKCESGHVFDIVQRISEDPLSNCIECGAPVRKVLHPVGISFKGSGFYSTDYRRNGKASDASTDTSGSETKGGDGSEKTSEQKSESKDKSGSSSSESSAKKQDQSSSQKD